MLKNQPLLLLITVHFLVLWAVAERDAADRRAYNRGQPAAAQPPNPSSRPLPSDGVSVPVCVRGSNNGTAADVLTTSCGAFGCDTVVVALRVVE